MKFSEICKRQPAIKAVIKDMKSMATRVGYYEAYVHGKEILSYLVGYDACDSLLKTSMVYDIVIEELAEACERGDVVYIKDKNPILNLAIRERPPKENLEVDMLVGKIAFCLWLSTQEDRNDSVGELARTFMENNDLLKGMRTEEIVAFLKDRHSNLHNILSDAHAEFKRERGKAAWPA